MVNEILAQSSWTEDDPSAGHWRTRDGQEVDLVLESRDGRLTCFEVKAGTRIRAEDLRGLRTLRSLVGDDFAAGIVLYTGRYTCLPPGYTSYATAPRCRRRSPRSGDSGTQVGVARRTG